VGLGDNAPKIAEYFKSHGFNKFTMVKNMAEAVNKARGYADEGDVVLLNPGFASFDYFKDFSERGEAFKDAVKRN